MLLHDDFIPIGGCCEKVSLEMQSEKVGLESRHVAGQSFARISLRVHGNEDDLEVAGQGLELFLKLFHPRKREGTDIRAVRVPEKDDDHVAMKVAQTEV